MPTRRSAPATACELRVLFASISRDPRYEAYLKSLGMPPERED